MTKVTEEFMGDWQAPFQKAGYDNFDQIWHASLGFVDEPNIGRGGRSDVGTLQLEDQQGKPRIFYVKRQVNYISKTLSHPIKGIPLTLKEFNNIQLFNQLGIPCMQACYQGFRHHQGELQSILITEELQGYQDLTLFKPRSIAQSRRISRELARLIALLHGAGYRHGCLYPKHIFINIDNADQPVCLIDLEKVVRSPLKQHNQLKDLGTLHRRSDFNKSSELHFLLCYLQADKNSAKVRKLIQALDIRQKRKEAR